MAEVAMRCGGHSLVEAMAAAFVLAVGVVGALASHALSIRTRHDSALASRAVYLAQALGERMRANPAARAGGDAADPYLTLDYASAGSAAPEAGVSCHGAASCDSGQLASFDIHEAMQAVAEDFPAGRVRVCRDARSWDDAVHALAWDCLPLPGAPVVIKIGWGARAPGAAASAAPRIVLPVPEGAP